MRRPRPLAEIERRAIREAIIFCKGNYVAAAVILGIGKTSIYRKMNEYERERKRRLRRRR